MDYTTIIIVIIVIVVYFKKSYTYWRNKKMPYINPTMPFGNLDSYKVLYEKFKSQGQKHAGVYVLTTPVYLPIHPDYIANVLQGDSDYFSERPFYYNKKDDPLSANLFSLQGLEWQNLHIKLSSTLSMSNLKMLFHHFLQCGTQMQDDLASYSETLAPVDIKDVVARYSVDAIGSSVFGLECNSFKNPNSELRRLMLKMSVFDPLSVSISRAIKNTFAVWFPETARWLNMTLYSTESTEFFLRVAKDTMRHRGNNYIKRKDMLQILIDLRQELMKTGEGLTIEELTAQAVLFLVKGVETTTTTLTFCLYELALNYEIQRKLRTEIKEIWAKYDGEVTFEGILQMKYMTQVAEETLRKYPALLTIYRICGKNYKIHKTDITLENNTRVAISVMGLHYNPDYYPDPQRFDPDRFSELRKKQIPNFAYLPFGGGLRNCMGVRFAMLHIKVGLALFLLKYKVLPNQLTTTSALTLDVYGRIPTTRIPIILNVEKAGFQPVTKLKKLGAKIKDTMNQVNNFIVDAYFDDLL